MTQEWTDFYGRPLTFKRYLWRIVNHLDFLYNIIQYKPRKVLEIGIGTAAHSFFINNFVPFVVGIDNDLNIIKFAKYSNRCRGKDVKFLVADAFNLPFKENSFSLCFSQGFFEHFNDIETNNLVNEQLRVANSTIFSIPSKNYESKDFGNEKLLTKKEWLQLLISGGKKRQFVINVKYSFTGLRLIGFFILHRYCIGALEVIAFIKKRVTK